MKQNRGLNFKTAALITALVLTVPCALFAGGQGGTRAGAVGSDNFNPTGLPIVKQPITITGFIWLNPNYPTDVNNSPYWQMVEKATGIHVEWDVMQGSDGTQKKNLVLASGVYPDVWVQALEVNDEETYGVMEKVLLPLDEYINDQHMPIFYNVFKDYPLLQKQNKATDGKYYTIPHIATGMDASVDKSIALNKKWLDKLGLKPPATITEFENVLRAFKTRDPNGNGKADEIPFETDFREFGDLFGCFGVLDTGNSDAANNGLVLENNKVSMPIVSNPKYREALEWFSKIYREGLLDPEFLTQNRATTWSKTKMGNAGGFMNYRWHNMQYSYEGIWDDYIVILPPAAPGVKPVWRWDAAKTGSGTNISKTNRYVKETIRWIDYQMDPVIAIQGRQGVLGVTMIQDSNGKYVLKPKADGSLPTNEEMAVAGRGYIRFLPSAIWNQVYGLEIALEERKDFYKMYNDAGILSKDPQNTLGLGRLSSDEQQRRALLGTDIEKFIDESLVAFIQDGVTDRSWQNFQTTLKQMRVEEYVALYQKAYDNFNR
jgi:putative aldouronate transport system substrate-binding protein